MIDGLASVPVADSLLAMKAVARQGSPASWLSQQQRASAGTAQYAPSLTNTEVESQP